MWVIGVGGVVSAAWYVGFHVCWGNCLLRTVLQTGHSRNLQKRFHPRETVLDLAFIGFLPSPSFGWRVNTLCDMALHGTNQLMLASSCRTTHNTALAWLCSGT